MTTMKSQEPVYLANRFAAHQGGAAGVRARRGEHNIRVDYRLSIARGGFVYRGAQLWNMIPLDIKSANSIGSFFNKGEKVDQAEH